MAQTIAEEIEELRNKLALLDGDKKAYEESASSRKEQNKALIGRLRAENKVLRSKLAAKLKADDDVLSSVFSKYGVKQPAELKGINGQEAVVRFDQRVCEMIKRFNALQAAAQTKAEMLDKLQVEYNLMSQEAAAILATPAGDLPAAHMCKDLENRLDKAIIRCNEANHVKKMYQQVVEQLQEERLEFDNQIDILEKNIRQRRKNLKDLTMMCNDAQIARDMAKAELSRQEQASSEARKERERILSEYKKQADEKKEFAERVERRLHHMSVENDVTQAEVQISIGGQDQEAKISSYEDALAKIKDTTGVSDIQEVVDRFLSQGDTKRHLESLKEENSKQLARLKEEKEKLQMQFEEMKYSGEAKMSSGQRMLEEFQTHLTEGEKSCEEAEARADQAAKLMTTVKAGVEHLAEKLQHLKAPHSHTLKPKMDTSSDEFILDQLSTCEQKLVMLVEELSSRDLEIIQKEMEDHETSSNMADFVPTNNIRVTIPKTSSHSTMFESDSSSDEEFVSRETIKRNVNNLLDSKAKKKPQDDDDTGKKKRRK